jgi:radical SAM-linked protein
MPRLLFEKRGNAVWISHLDLMRVFQRAFKRAGLPLKHTQGFNPRPSVSIALPLSVGVESCCELLDFELDGERVSNDDIRTRLNEVLVAEVQVLSVYDGGGKIGNLALLDCSVWLEYDSGIPDLAEERIRALFERSAIVLPKKTKSGIQDQDIIPMIRKIDVSVADANTLLLRALVHCQNPTLNPTQLSLAVATYLPDLKPDHCRYMRHEVFDETETVFR